MLTGLGGLLIIISVNSGTCALCVACRAGDQNAVRRGKSVDRKSYLYAVADGRIAKSVVEMREIRLKMSDHGTRRVGRKARGSQGISRVQFLRTSQWRDTDESMEGGCGQKGEINVHRMDVGGPKAESRNDSKCNAESM